MNNTRDPPPDAHSPATYPSLRRRPAQRGTPPDLYVMQADSTGSYIEHWHAPHGNMQRVSAIRGGVRTGDVAYELGDDGFGGEAGAQPARRAQRSWTYYEPGFEVSYDEGEEEAIQKSLEDQDEKVAIQRSREDQLVGGGQEAEAVRRSLEDQGILRQEKEEQEVLMRALARQEALLTRFAEERSGAREQEDLVAQLRERLVVLER